VLQDRTIQRLGGNELLPVDVRVLAATHRNLEESIAEQEFREDLFFRLSVVTITVPSLAERREDIPELVRHFLSRHAGELGVERPSIHPDALVILERQPWPGNVRELENVIRSALVLARPFSIGPDHVNQAITRSRRPVQTAEQSHSTYIASLLDRAERGELTDAYWRMVEDLEPELFTQAFRRASGNQAQMARWLGVTRLKLREKLRRLGLHAKD
jgi:DNA-binding NtrC family response regulator